MAATIGTGAAGNEAYDGSGRRRTVCKPVHGVFPAEAGSCASPSPCRACHYPEVALNIAANLGTGRKHGKVARRTRFPASRGQPFPPVDEMRVMSSPKARERRASGRLGFSVVVNLGYSFRCFLAVEPGNPVYW